MNLPRGEKITVKNGVLNVPDPRLFLLSLGTEPVGYMGRSFRVWMRPWKRPIRAGAKSCGTVLAGEKLLILPVNGCRSRPWTLSAIV